MIRHQVHGPGTFISLIVHAGRACGNYLCCGNMCTAISSHSDYELHSGMQRCGMHHLSFYDAVHVIVKIKKCVEVIAAESACVCTKDVYGEIAATVRESVAADAARGVPEAIALRDQIDRKLVKQTVMTSVYGVTFIGARMQIQNRLIERGWANNDALYKCSNYASKVGTGFCAPTELAGVQTQGLAHGWPPMAMRHGHHLLT